MAEIVLLEERGIPISYIDGIGLYGLIVTGDLLPLQLESGKTYTVVWNGTRHTRTAIEMSVMGMTGVAVGNAAIVGGEADPENLDFFLFTVPADGRVGILTPTEATTATVGLYEVIEEESLILKNPQGNDAKYPMKQMIRLNTTKGTKIYSKGEAIENVAVTLDLTSGDQTINAPDGYLVKSAVIKKPEDAQPENILKNKNIGGIVGELEMPEKITATIDLDFSEGDMVVTPDAGKVFSSVTVIKPANLVPENIAKNEVVAGVVGTHEGGGSGGGSCRIPYIVTSSNNTSKWCYNQKGQTLDIGIAAAIPLDAEVQWVAYTWTYAGSSSTSGPFNIAINMRDGNAEYTVTVGSTYKSVRIGKRISVSHIYFIYALAVFVTHSLPGFWYLENNGVKTLEADETVNTIYYLANAYYTAGYRVVDVIDFSKSKMTSLNDFDLSTIGKKKIILPPTVTSFSTGLKNFHGTIDLSLFTSVPTISTNAITAGEGLQILVPSALYDSWISATNWSAIADYIVAKQGE